MTSDQTLHHFLEHGLATARRIILEGLASNSDHVDLSFDFHEVEIDRSSNMVTVSTILAADESAVISLDEFRALIK